MDLQGYVDAKMASDSDSRKITTGYAYTISGTTVSWVSRLQNIVALYTTEAKYVAMTEATKELVWLHNFLDDLGQNRKNILYYDSHSAIHLAKDCIMPGQNIYKFDITTYNQSCRMENWLLRRLRGIKIQLIC